MIRVWHLLRRIPRAPRKITALELTQQLASEGFVVSKRTTERDLQTLSAIFPLESDERSKPFGWCWSRDAGAFDVPGMSQEEAIALNLVEQHLNRLIPTALLDSLAPRLHNARAVLDKISCPVNQIPWTDKVTVVPAWMNLLPAQVDSHVQTLVYEGLLRERQLNITYKHRGGDKCDEWRIQPLGLVQRGQVLYLVARVFDYEPRTLALHRIIKAELLEQVVVRPEGFTLEHYVAQGKFEFSQAEPEPLHLRFYHGAGDHLLETPMTEDQLLTDKGDGVLDVQAQVRHTSQLEWWLLGFGPNVEVLEPAALRESIARMVQEAAARYSSGVR